MQSIYQDPAFARFWNNRVGDEGEDYKRFVLDPLMLGWLGSLKKKSVLELGCGNGYLAKEFLSSGAEKAILMDISAENIKYARSRITDSRVTFIEHDATTTWPLADQSVDMIYSNMMLNEVMDLATPLSESYRVLKTGGQIAASVLHPAFMLFFYAQQQAGLDSGKFQDLGGYFNQKQLGYMMGKVSITKSAVDQAVNQDYAVVQSQRTVSDYLNGFITAGLTIKKIAEPQLNEDILKHNPSFAKYQDRPIGLVIYCQKLHK